MRRVALLVNFIPPYRVSLFKALQARVGHLRVFVSTPMEPNRSWSVDWSGLDVVVQRNLTMRKRWRDGAAFTDDGFVHFPYDTLAQLRRFRPDAIISSELGLRTALSAAYKLLHPDVRLVMWATISERTEGHRGTLRGLLRPRLLKRADAVLVNGASGARYVMKLGVPADRVVRAPYTTDVAAFRTDGVKRRSVAGLWRLLFTGMFVERKGLLPFLEVLRQWAGDHPDHRIEFEIVGDGPLRASLEAFASVPNLCVTIRRAIPYSDLPALYSSADIFVLPTLADEWGVVVNEAMAAGLPVLGSCHSQAVEELVGESEAGWTFRPERRETVYQAIDRALHSTLDERQRMGAVACRRVFELTPDLIAGRIADILCQNPPSS
jgi:glycosyltransferase involved in cell wall biosynthesis